MLLVRTEEQEMASRALQEHPLGNSNDNDSTLVEKLRWSNWEQYQTLVRMHLSFALDLATDEWDVSTSKSESRQQKRVLTPFSKKGSKTQPKGVMEGANLTQEGVCQAYQLIEFLTREENLLTEGLFRRSGRVSRQSQLKALLNRGATLDLNAREYTVHEVACVLKGFLAELPEPLLTEAHYSVHCQIAELVSCPDSPPELKEQVKNRQIRSLQLLFLLLPPENHQLLQDLLQLLHQVAIRSDQNKMSPVNLATVFAPHLLYPRKLPPETLQLKSSLLTQAVSFMIENAEKLFCVPAELAVDVRAYWAAQKVSNQHQGEEGQVASTVFTFVDRARTAEVSAGSSTEVALAELYAYVQALPESGRKRRLVRQFNKENGLGTPALSHRTRNASGQGSTGGGEARRRVRSRSFGDSIKRHLFSRHKHKTGTGAVSHYSLHRAASDDNILSPTDTGSPPLKLKVFQKSTESLDCQLEGSASTPCSSSEISVWPKEVETRTTINSTVPTGSKGPRCLSDSALCCHDNHILTSVSSSSSSDPTSGEALACNCSRTRMMGMLSCILPTRRKGLPMSFDSRQQPASEALNLEMVTFTPTFEGHLPPTNRIVLNTPTAYFAAAINPDATTNATTTTPDAATAANTSLVLSPLTRSAQRMPRMLQESILTPRNRRPLVLTSSSDLATPPDFPLSLPLASARTPSTAQKKEEDPLSEQFRKYLLARHMSPLAISPPQEEQAVEVTEDCTSSTPDGEDIPEEEEEDGGKVEEEELSRSMLFFLDGNQAEDGDQEEESPDSCGQVESLRSAE